jgi:hypothetical protein
MGLVARSSRTGLTHHLPVVNTFIPRSAHFFSTAQMIEASGAFFTSALPAEMAIGANPLSRQDQY